MAFLDAVLSLSQASAREDALQRILQVLARAASADALSVLTAAEDGSVTVVAQVGLSPAALDLCFQTREHPRLLRAAQATMPIRFRDDASEPDPYTGMLLGDSARGQSIHACLAAPLRVQEQLVGLLTLDARTPGVFDGVLDEDLRVFAGLCAAALRLDAGPHARSAMLSGGAAPLGRSAPMQRLEREIDVLAPLSTPVLVLGETGAGKERVARALHERSPRAIRPLVIVNCAALPEHLVESELFGHKKGAFTGAASSRTGRFDAADGGTLFLDEIGELPLAAQAQLLRALQEGEIQRVGEDRAHRVDVRVVAATNRDLRREVSEGRFRADLFHRLWVCPISVPALRERREDIPPLCEQFAAAFGPQLGITSTGFTGPALRALSQGTWPGNVRELKNTVERAMMRRRMAEGAGLARLVLGPADFELEPADLERERPGRAGVAAPGEARLWRPGNPEELSAEVEPLAETLERVKREAFTRAFRAAGGNAAMAGRLLGLSRSFTYKEAVRLGLIPAPEGRRR